MVDDERPAHRDQDHTCGAQWLRCVLTESGRPDAAELDELRRPLDLLRLRELTASTHSTWQSIEIVDETGSTNSDLLARARSGRSIDGAVLIAEHQTAGRGRAGRSWTAVPRAQILLSVGVGADAVPPDMWGWIPLAMGVAVADAVQGQCGVAAGLKWPNDVLVGEAKLAGILAEVAAPDAVIVVGLGLNVSLRADDVIGGAATSLLELADAVPERDVLIARVLERFAERVADWRSSAGRHMDLRADYAARSVTIGSSVRVQMPGGELIAGVATAVDERGCLQVLRDGTTISLSAGDVVHVRSAERGC